MMTSKLMDRIIVSSWLTKDYQTKLDKIKAIQALRVNDQAQSRIKKGGKTKSAMKNLKKRGKDPEAAAKAALAKLTPAQLAALTAKLT